MNKSTLVSIVLPIYNCEEYIVHTLECIASQTYMNLEIICISDGCTDNSVSIIQSFAKYDQRINVIENLDNAGAAVRRNQGLRIASGEWITFWDADDIYEKTYISSMLNIADKDTQLIICDYDLIGNLNRNNSYKYNDSSFDFRNVISCAPCNKMVRRDFLLEKEIEFQNIPNCNDFYFSTVCLLKAEQVKYLDKILWHYRFEQTDNTSRKREKRCYILTALDALYEKLPLSQKDMYINAFARFAEQHILGYRKFSSYNEIIKEYEEKYKKKWKVSLNLDKEFYIKDTSIFDGKKLAIICAGGVGTDYYTQLIENKKTIVGCFDNACKINGRLPIEIKPVEKVIDITFDIAIIAVRDVKIANQVTKQLIGLGIDKDKIWWNKPERYLFGDE